ncbi:ABC transporter substrate-binding protein [Variovorax saccharolyticus]|uniref:ABC transporter substrate-binding protein n=1 Tax=Variovorax saccharolyticus TaxID=3053516 RepID=UPI002577BAA0|nr:ABC transporter substrate-binding protein [Variovorax sp. J22R187]MDM0017911.1 ABC transporter substrate-binding protein [Variovorax sp. J22R187]
MRIRLPAVLSALAAALLASAGMTGAASAAEPMNLMLNWTPTADHAPIYFAKAKGWYTEAGIDLTIEAGKGSALSAQRVGSGGANLGIADLPTAIQAVGKGADLKAVMVIYANSPQGFYWLKSSGINAPKDFAGRKIGNPPGDAARLMWPAFAKKTGIDPAAVNFVNLSPQAKVGALKSKSVDIISDFYNEHDLKVREFGPDLGFVAWRDIGVNVYGNSLMVNGAYLAANPERIRKFAAVTQRAYSACVKDFAPCLDALTASVSGLSPDNQRDQWGRIKQLMRDDTTTKVALGAFDGARVKADYELVQSLIGLDKPFDPARLYTNDYLDKGVRMPAE